MKKFLFLLALLSLPTISFGTTITTTSSNVPVQTSISSPQVIMVLPKFTRLELISTNGNWYNIKYRGVTGWIYSGYASNSTLGGNSNDASLNIGNDEKMSRIVSAANTYGNKFGVDPNLILAVIYTESGFDPYAVSVANCKGLMQVSATYAPSLGFDTSRLFEIEYNIECGTSILKTKLNEMGNTYDALRAYNAGTSGANSNSSLGSNYASKVLSTYEDYSKNGFHY